MNASFYYFHCKSSFFSFGTMPGTRRMTRARPPNKIKCVRRRIGRRETLEWDEYTCARVCSFVRPSETHRSIERLFSSGNAPENLAHFPVFLACRAAHKERKTFPPENENTTQKQRKWSAAKSAAQMTKELCRWRRQRRYTHGPNVSYLLRRKLPFFVTNRLLFFIFVSFPFVSRTPFALDWFFHLLHSIWVHIVAGAVADRERARPPFESLPSKLTFTFQMHRPKQKLRLHLICALREHDAIECRAHNGCKSQQSSNNEHFYFRFITNSSSNGATYTSYAHTLIRVQSLWLRSPLPPIHPRATLYACTRTCGSRHCFAAVQYLRFFVLSARAAAQLPTRETIKVDLFDLVFIVVSLVRGERTHTHDARYADVSSLRAKARQTIIT